MSDNNMDAIPIQTEPKVKPDIATRWADALVSGEFAQGQGRLKTDDGRYCCLGVLCELYRRETGNGEWKDKREIGAMRAPRFYQTPASHGAEEYPTESVYQWAGLHAGFANELASDNDAGESFETIAATIRAEAR